ncbi:hypothetical protein E4U41_004997, partial [Claviceps citrina]
ECASDEIKATCVDLLEWRRYGEVDLDQDPCIFPDCGHFLTVASMDGQMDMAAHYVLDADGHPVSINKVSEPFSMDGTGVRVCASCRGSLRNVARYGRIVRRATLDEATKKFISWSNAKHLGLESALLDAESALQKTAEGLDLDAGAVAVASRAKSKRPRNTHPRLGFLSFLDKDVKLKRYGALLQRWKDIDRFVEQVGEEEQPFQRVADLVRHTNRQRRTRKEFRFDGSVIQVKGLLRALLLRLRCEICVMSDLFLGTGTMRPAGPVLLPADCALDLTQQLQDCERITQLARESMYPREEVQALIYKAQLSAIGSSAAKKTSGSDDDDNGDPSSSSSLKQQGHRCLDQACRLLEAYPSTRIFEDVIDSVRKTLDSAGGHGTAATAEELRAAFMAMAGELGGSGRWYACVNGHYFTIGECGRPMEQSRCPDCGAGIGGRAHDLVEGVTVAEEMEELGRAVGRLGL